MADSTFAAKWIPADTGNYTKDRAAQGGRIAEITVHHCAGVMTVEALGALWQRVGRRGSSHYGVHDGAVGQYVAESDVAWTNGNWAANCRAVTIEVSNSGGAPQWPVSDASLQTLAQLAADIARRNGLGELCVGKNLTYHSMYAATACPGPYLLARLPDVAAKANAINREWRQQQAAASQAGGTAPGAGGPQTGGDAPAAAPLCKEPVTLCVGPASGGDRRTLRALAESLCLGYAEDAAGRMRIGPASAGDQVTILTKAAALGLAYGVNEPEAAGGAQPGAEASGEAARTQQLQAELAALKTALQELQGQRDAAQKTAEQAAAALSAAEARAESYLQTMREAKAQTEGYLQKINAAKAALEG